MNTLSSTGMPKTQQNLIQLSNHIQIKQFKKLLQKQQKFRVYNSCYHLSNLRNQIWLGTLWRLCAQLNYSAESFYLGLALFDLFSSEFSFCKSQLEVFSVLALDLAAKVKESRVTYIDFITHRAQLHETKHFSQSPASLLIKMQARIVDHLHF